MVLSEAELTSVVAYVARDLVKEAEWPRRLAGVYPRVAVPLRRGVGAAVVTAGLIAMIVPAAGETAAFLALANDHATAFEKALTEIGLIIAGIAVLLPMVVTLITVPVKATWDRSLATLRSAQHPSSPPGGSPPPPWPPAGSPPPSSRPAWLSPPPSSPPERER